MLGKQSIEANDVAYLRFQYDDVGELKDEVKLHEAVCGGQDVHHYLQDADALVVVDVLIDQLTDLNGEQQHRVDEVTQRKTYVKDETI